MEIKFFRIIGAFELRKIIPQPIIPIFIKIYRTLKSSKLSIIKYNIIKFIK